MISLVKREETASTLIFNMEGSRSGTDGFHLFSLRRPLIDSPILRGTISVCGDGFQNDFIIHKKGQVKTGCRFGTLNKMGDLGNGKVFARSE
jgi:hypothetical protein